MSDRTDAFNVGELLVMVQSEEEIDIAVDAIDEGPDQLEEQGIKDVVRRVVRRRVRTESVDMARLTQDLDRVQRDVEQLLSGRTEHKVGKMRLDEIQIGLALCAEGSIGVVTAGIEASISLVYRHSDTSDGTSTGDWRERLSPGRRASVADRPPPQSDGGM
jgi:hypothetical protein